MLRHRSQAEDAQRLKRRGGAHRFVFPVQCVYNTTLPRAIRRRRARVAPGSVVLYTHCTGRTNRLHFHRINWQSPRDSTSW